MMDVIPGDTVLVKIHNGAGQIPVYRPLMVTSVDWQLHLDKEEPAVSGELFLHVDQDRRYEWIQRLAFYLPDKDHRMIYCKNLLPGELIGNWISLSQARKKAKAETQGVSLAR